MRTISRGIVVDDEAKTWAVWMNKPKGLEIPDMTLYYQDGECRMNNVTNKKGIPMLVCRGKIPPMVRNLNSYLIQARADFTNFINKKKKEAGL